MYIASSLTNYNLFLIVVVFKRFQNLNFRKKVHLKWPQFFHFNTEKKIGNSNVAKVILAFFDIVRTHDSGFLYLNLI